MTVISSDDLFQGRGIFDQGTGVGTGRGCTNGVSGFEACFGRRGI